MVAVRSAHINKAGEFDPEKWIASLGITSQKSCECLAETWAYCLQQTQGHPDASLLLWRGVEMVEILSTLSMDIDTLRAALREKKQTHFLHQNNTGITQNLSYIGG